MSSVLLQSVKLRDPEGYPGNGEEFVAEWDKRVGYRVVSYDQNDVRRRQTSYPSPEAAMEALRRIALRRRSKGWVILEVRTVTYDRHGHMAVTSTAGFEERPKPRGVPKAAKTPTTAPGRVQAQAARWGERPLTVGAGRGER